MSREADVTFEVRPLTAFSDVNLLRPVLESAIRDLFTREIVTEDVEDILASLHSSDSGTEQKCTVVAWSTQEARALGMMSLRQPVDEMRPFAQSRSPIELTNAYVLAETRRSGIGKTLVRTLEDRARSAGHTEIILNSGPRFRFSGWPFWRRLYGEPVAIAKDYYGPHLDAPVWRKPLQ